MSVWRGFCGATDWLTFADVVMIETIIAIISSSSSSNHLQNRDYSCCCPDLDKLRSHPRVNSSPLSLFTLEWMFLSCSTKSKISLSCKSTALPPNRSPTWWPRAPAPVPCSMLQSSRWQVQHFHLYLGLKREPGETRLDGFLFGLFLQMSLKCRSARDGEEKQHFYNVKPNAMKKHFFSNLSRGRLNTHISDMYMQPSFFQFVAECRPECKIGMFCSTARAKST